MNQSVEGHAYRTFRNGKCYQLGVNFATFNDMRDYEPPTPDLTEHAIKEITPRSNRPSKRFGFAPRHRKSRALDDYYNWRARSERHQRRHPLLHFGTVWREHLVCKSHSPRAVQTELEFRIGDHQLAVGGQGSPALVDGHVQGIPYRQE